MNAATPPRDGRPALSPTGPVLVWLLIQFVALALALLGVPLWAGHRDPGERFAAQIVLVTQLAAAALLFPYLLRSPGAAVAVIATAWPFVVIGGVFSAVPGDRIAASAAFVMAWLATLWAVRTAAGPRVGFVSAISALLVIGGPILLYLTLEYFEVANGSVAGAAIDWARASPPLAAIDMLTTSPHPARWAIPAAVSAIAMVIHGIGSRIHQLIHRS